MLYKELIHSQAGCPVPLDLSITGMHLTSCLFDQLMTLKGEVMDLFSHLLRGECKRPISTYVYYNSTEEPLTLTPRYVL